MLDRFDPDSVKHVSMNNVAGDASNSVITPEAFSCAISEITSWPSYEPTPLYQLDALATEIGIQKLYYKDEGPRFGLGSFKALGGAYAALRVLTRELTHRLGHNVEVKDVSCGKYAKEAASITLVSATDGNHGRSLAWGCQKFGASCRIYIHAEVSNNRKEAMANLSAEVVRIDGDYDESVRVARKEADENGYLVVSDTSWEGYTQPPRDVMSGYGVMAYEICEELSEPPTHVLLQGGVGGLAAGVAAYFKQRWGKQSPRVVIVEPALAACLYASAQTGKRTSVHIQEETIMAGLSCGEPSPLAWQILSEEAYDYVTLDEDLVAPTMKLLAEPFAGDSPIEAGESAVAGLAALIAICASDDMREALGIDQDSRVLAIGSEGITDPEVYQKMLAAAS